jgi:hypothetical protein
MVVIGKEKYISACKNSFTSLMRKVNSISSVCLNVSFLTSLGEDPETDFKYNKFRNQFAIGNFINHPPKDKEPNVMSHAIDFLVNLYVFV